MPTSMKSTNHFFPNHPIRKDLHHATLWHMVWAIILFLSPSSLVFAQATFSERIASLGMEEVKTDWSDNTDIVLPLPTCAYANITGINRLPTTKTANYHAWMEVYDGNGNFFKKRIIISAQGRGSGQYEKKNLKIDFCEDEWVGEETTNITFGDWVKQDGFHLKAFFNDIIKGTAIAAYRTYDLISRGRGEYGRIWERANLNDPDVKALCHPDAFPLVLYFNGEFRGLYCWQLKKHRKNMNQKKNTPEHIHLEGYPLNRENFWYGNINWKKVWVRTPKDLYDMDGNVYDSDNPTELMEETSPYYNLATDDAKTRERKQNTAKVKNYLVELSQSFSQLTTLANNGASKDEMRAAIEEWYDVPGIIDYILHNLLTVNWDGLWSNYQWFTYDGKKWYVAPYDLDNTYGYGHHRILPAGYYYNNILLSKRTFQHCPTHWIMQYFKDEVYERWAEIRNQGFITPENIYSIFDTWYHSFGEENYRLEKAMWPNSLSLVKDIENAPWEQLPFNYTAFSKAPTWDENTTYEANTVVKLVNRIYKANEQVKGVRPYKQIGKLDSLGRFYPYLKVHIAAIDKLTKYSFTSTLMSHTLTVSSVGWSTVCLPFQFAVPEEMSVYAVNGKLDQNTLHLVKVTTPEANKPYLVKAPPGNYLLTGYSEEQEDDDNGLLENGCLRGTLAPRYVPAGNYVLQNHNGDTGFYRVAEDGKVRMGANRAWLSIEDANANSFLLDDLATGITPMESVPQVVSIHDMRGIKQNGIGKGINIIRYSNGKRVKMVR